MNREFVARTLRLSVALAALPLAACLDDTFSKSTAMESTTSAAAENGATSGAASGAADSGTATGGTATGSLSAGTAAPSAGAATTTTAPTATTATTATTAAVNTMPTIAGTPATAASAGVMYAFAPAAYDANNDTLSYSVANLPRWASFSSTTGQISGTPSTADLGSYANIIVSVSDGKATVALPAFKVDVMLAAATGTLTLTWNPPLQNTDGSALTDLAGYVVYYGKDATNLNYFERLPGNTQVLFAARRLDAGAWNFSIRSYNAAGTLSDPVLLKADIT